MWKQTSFPVLPSIYPNLTSEHNRKKIKQFTVRIAMISICLIPPEIKFTNAISPLSVSSSPTFLALPNQMTKGNIFPFPVSPPHPINFPFHKFSFFSCSENRNKSFMPRNIICVSILESHKWQAATKLVILQKCKSVSTLFFSRLFENSFS